MKNATRSSPASLRLLRAWAFLPDPILNPRTCLAPLRSIPIAATLHKPLAEMDAVEHLPHYFQLREISTQHLVDENLRLGDPQPAYRAFEKSLQLVVESALADTPHSTAR